MKFVKVISNLQDVGRMEINRQISWFISHTGVDYYKILNQIDGFNFIMDRGYFFKLNNLFKEKYNKPIVQTFGGYIDDKSSFTPAICINTHKQLFVFSIDKVNIMQGDFIFAEQREMSIDWLAILKQKFGIGLLQKLTIMAQNGKEQQIKQVEQK